MANEIINYNSDRFIDFGTGTSDLFCAVGHYDGENTSGALRFSGVNIPQGTSVNFAKIFYDYNSVGSTSGTWKWRLYGIDEDNTSDFSSNPMGRTRTSAYNQYNEGEPTTGGTKTLDAESIVNEIVGRGGWSSGNAMGFLLINDGSDADVYAFAEVTTTYLAYRLSAEPNFKPTPISVTAPTIPATTDYGIKISKPGVSVLTATEEDTYFSTRKQQFKVLTQAYYQSVTADITAGYKTIAHNLGYIPFASIYVKSSVFGGGWKKLPIAHQFEDHPTYYIDDTNIYLHSAVVGEEFYYYIYNDQLAT